MVHSPSSSIITFPISPVTSSPILNPVIHSSSAMPFLCFLTPLLPSSLRPRPHPVPTFLSRTTPRQIPYACETPPPSTLVDTLSSPSSPTFTPSPSLSPAPPSSYAPETKKKPSSPPPTPAATTAIPGPTPLPLVGNALDIVGLQLSDLMLKYATNYGPFVKFAIVTDVMFLASDPAAIQKVTGSNARNYLDRWTPPGFQVLLYDGNLRGVVFSQGRYWMQHRQVVGSVFRSMQFLDHYVNTTIEKSNFLLENLWEGKVAQVVNMHKEMRMLTLDIIGMGAFGTEFGAMRSEDGTHEIEQCLGNVLHGVMDVIKCPLPLWRVMRTPGRASIENDLRRLQNIELGLIQERRKRLIEEGTLAENRNPRGKKDLLGLLLRARDSQSKSVYFKDEDMMWDVHDVIFAGHETTASSLAASIWLIAGSERVRIKICQELDTVLPHGRSPTFEDLPKLKYLDMVLSEALRLYPPTALIGRVAKEADVISGYQVPAGASIVMSPYVMGRLENIWDNPLEFRPERFEPQNIAKRHPMSHVPFGAGPRVCLGARMATMEAKIVLAMIFQRFTLERTQNELEVLYDSTVSFKSGMDMIIRRRV